MRTSPTSPLRCRADTLPPAWCQKTPRGTAAVSHGIRQAHTSPLAAGGLRAPLQQGTPLLAPTGILRWLASLTISQGCPWEPTVPPKGHRAGRGEQAGL